MQIEYVIRVNDFEMYHFKFEKRSCIINDTSVFSSSYAHFLCTYIVYAVVILSYSDVDITFFSSLAV